MKDIVKFENLKKLIIEIRDEKALLDVDVAGIYGVETKRINESNFHAFHDIIRISG